MEAIVSELDVINATFAHSFSLFSPYSRAAEPATPMFDPLGMEHVASPMLLLLFMSALAALLAQICGVIQLLFGGLEVPQWQRKSFEMSKEYTIEESAVPDLSEEN